MAHLDDPWHRETLDALVTYLRTAKRGVRAVVVTSGASLAEALESDLRQELGQDADILEIDLSGNEDPVASLVSVVRADSRPGRLVLVKGLSEQVVHQDPPGAVPAVLRYINFNRELFDRDGESYLFLLDPDAASQLAEHSPDFNRYTQRFELIEWSDVLAAASHEAQQSITRVEDHEALARDAKSMIDTIRGRPNPDLEVLVKLLLRSSRYLENLGRPDEALKVALEASDETAALGDPALEADSLRWVGRGYYELGPLEKAEAVTRQALGTAYRTDDSQVRSDIHGLLGTILNGAGRLREALAECQTAENLDRGRDDAYRKALVISDTYLKLGDVESAHQSIIKDTEEKDRQGFQDLMLSMLLAQIELVRGRLERSTNNLGRALFLMKSTHVEVHHRRLLATLANLEFLKGRPARARELLEKLLTETRQPGVSKIHPAILLSEVLLAMAIDSEAGRLIEDVRAEIRSTGFFVYAAEADLALSRVLETEGDLDQAREMAQTAIEESASQERALVTATGQRQLGRLHRLQGDLEKAAPLYAKALETHRCAGARPDETRDLVELSFLAHDQGDAESARRHARDALAILRDTGIRFDEPAALAALAAAYDLAGRSDLADPVHRRWRRLVDGMQAPGLRRWIERSLESPLMDESSSPR